MHHTYCTTFGLLMCVFDADSSVEMGAGTVLISSLFARSHRTAKMRANHTHELTQHVASLGLKAAAAAMVNFLQGAEGGP